MNWYKQLKSAEVRGEFWIDDSGNVMEASGDGDYNHEGYVIDYAQSSLAEGEDYEGWKTSSAMKILEEKKAELEDKKDEMEDVEQDTTQITKEIDDIWEQSRDIDYYAYKLLMDSFSPEEMELFNIAEMQGDPRTYAMKKWGWKRLEGKHIETWNLTVRDLNVIANGLYDAYGQMEENSLDNEEFAIYVYSTKMWYNAVHWEDIHKQNIRAITGNRLSVR